MQFLIEAIVFVITPSPILTFDTKTMHFCISTCSVQVEIPLKSDCLLNEAQYKAVNQKRGNLCKKNPKKHFILRDKESLE